MGSDQGDQYSSGLQDDRAEAPELLLTWLVAAAAVVLLLLVAAVVAAQEQVLVAVVQSQVDATSPSPTETPTPVQTLAPSTPEPSVSSAASSSPSSLCDIPPGWIEYRIRWGDSLSGLASKHSLSVKDFKEANCLEGNTIFAGSTLWVPSGTRTPATGAVTPGSETATPGMAEPPGEGSIPPANTVESGPPVRPAPQGTGTPGP